MKDDDEEIGKEEEAKPGLSAFSTYDYSTIHDKDIKLIGKKTKRPEKTTSNKIVQLIGRVRKTYEPSVRQALLNEITKTNDFSYEGVMKAALKKGFSVNKGEADFIAELGKSKIMVNKIGIPSNLCRKKLHYYYLTTNYNLQKVITDDPLMWISTVIVRWKTDKLYKTYSRFTGKVDVKKFTFVTDTLIQNSVTYSGYCQDKDPGILFLRSKDLNTDEVQKEINDPKSGYEDYQLNSQPYVLIEGNNFLICCPTNYISRDNIAATAVNLSAIKCFNSKNKLSDGLKSIKKNNEYGTYLNLHEIKVTDFCPSCVFLETPVNDARVLIYMELDNNVIYNNIRNVEKSIKDLKLPPNCVFWDNYSSFMEMLCVLDISKFNPDAPIKKEINEVYTNYVNNKSAFQAWAVIYRTFDEIVMGFYDSITSKMTYDQIIRLKSKIDFFVDNYNYLQSNEATAEIAKILNTIGDACSLMQMFISNNTALELATSIRKIIRMLIEQQISKTMDYVRTVGIMCLQVMYDGNVPMIPKIRSKSSFLGNIGGGVITSKNVIGNILALAKKFEKDISADEGEDFMDKLSAVNDLIDQMIDNSIEIYNKGALKPQKDNVRKYIREERELFNNIFEDVLGMYESPDYTTKEMEALTLLDNINLLNFLQLVESIIKKLTLVSKTVDSSNLPKVMKLKKIKPSKGKPTPDQFKKNRATINRSGKPPDKEIKDQFKDIGGGFQKIDGKELLAEGIIQELKEGYNQETAAKAMDTLPAPLPM